ncbi:LAMI_0A05864g1_1 [Lachancea mirantina]|uniref:LAMI_0A05864g1_1 n=1 Tax=Lachancea mirantina TaxID=1230905 RepID=A0A1G4IPU2_9SACH|nr:LAMI_0A05864g1_1 [Lachancea mirantina]
MLPANDASAVMGLFAQVLKLSQVLQRVIITMNRVVEASALLFYRSFLRPAMKMFTLFCYSPAQIITKNVLRILFLPTNLLLMLIYGASLDDLRHVNIHLAAVTGTLCIQYFITLLVVGILTGVYCGATLGFVHKHIRIPDKYIEFPQNIYNRLFPSFGTHKETLQPPPFEYPSASSQRSSISISVPTDGLGRKQPRSSRGSVSHAVSKLPHDFFQPKTPKKPESRRMNGLAKFSPVSMDAGSPGDINSLTSSIWDERGNAVETLKTDVSGKIYQDEKGFASGRDQTSYINLRALRTAVRDQN